MADTQNEHRLRRHPIADDIGPHDRHFADPTAGLAPTLRKFGKTLGNSNQSLGEMARGIGIEGHDIGRDRVEI